MMRLDATRLHAGPLEPPPSKSDAHRAFALAWMLGLAAPTGERWPDDVERLRRGLTLIGTGEPIDCGDGAAPFRILLGLAAQHPGRTVLGGSARLRERPHTPLFEALELAQPGWPVTLTGSPRTSFSIHSALSSQFASALVLAACSTRSPASVRLIGPTASRGYLDLTLRWARGAGFLIDETAERIDVLGCRPVAKLPAIPPDWSSLGYLLLIARASGSRVDVSDPGPHPDRAVLGYLTADGFDADVSKHPDLAPTLAALALAGERPCTLRNVSILRLKESDRLAGIIDLAAAAHGRARLDGDVLHLEPGRPIERLRFDCRHDHRLIMTAVSLACLLRTRAELSRATGVEKSFPGFFAQAAAIGVRVAP